jgi:hypothetical protein
MVRDRKRNLSKTALGILESLINPNSGRTARARTADFFSVTVSASFWIIRWTRSEVTMRTSLAIVSTTVALLAVGSLTIMNKACKSSQHERCASMSTVVSASIGHQFTCVCVLRRRLVARHHLWLLSKQQPLLLRYCGDLLERNARRQIWWVIRHSIVLRDYAPMNLFVDVLFCRIFAAAEIAVMNSDRRQNLSIVWE